MALIADAFDEPGPVSLERVVARIHAVHRVGDHPLGRADGEQRMPLDGPAVPSLERIVWIPAAPEVERLPPPRQLSVIPVVPGTDRGRVDTNDLCNPGRFGELLDKRHLKVRQTVSGCGTLVSRALIERPVPFALENVPKEHV